MNSELEQLKRIVRERGDEDSKKHVLDYEKRLREVSLRERMAENPVIQEYIAYLTFQIERCNTRLTTDRTLTDRERDALFERKELCDNFTSIFNGKQRAGIESAIRQDLAHAKAS